MSGSQGVSQSVRKKFETCSIHLHEQNLFRGHKVTSGDIRLQDDDIRCHQMTKCHKS